MYYQSVGVHQVPAMLSQTPTYLSLIDVLRLLDPSKLVSELGDGIGERADVASPVGDEVAVVGR